MRSVSVLGAGNTGCSIAANLALRGWEVVLCDLPEFAGALAPIRTAGGLYLDGVAECGFARFAALTTDVGEALRANRLALLSVPAYGHAAWARACAPHLGESHAIVLLPGTLGSLEFRRIVGPTRALVAETDTAPYVCRRIAPDRAHIWGVVSALGVAAIPARRSAEAIESLAPIFTRDGREGSPATLRAYPDVLACGLNAMNPVVHGVGVLLNAGRIERSRGEFYFYEEGVTPAVARAIEAVDRERRAVAAALGYDLPSAAEAFHEAGFGPAGDLWAAINGSRMLTALRAPGALDHRWLTEDVPYGLAAWALLGERVGIPTPVIRSVVTLAGALLGRDFWREARTPERLGLIGGDAPALRALAADPP